MRVSPEENLWCLDRYYFRGGHHCFLRWSKVHFLRWDRSATSTGERDSSEFGSLVSPVSSGSPHTPLCQLPGTHASLSNDLILAVDIPWDWEFTLCCNSVTHRMTFWFWLFRYLSSAAMVDKGLFQGRQKLSGHLYRLGIELLRSYSPPPCFPVVWEQLVNFITLIISTKVVKGSCARQYRTLPFVSIWLWILWW